MVPRRGVGLPAARSAATASELERVPANWVAVCKKAGYNLRSSQAWLLAGVASGRDMAGVAATGAGKSVAWLAPVSACEDLR